jgi:hypothetical protein
VSTSHGWLKTALQSLQGLASKATKQRALKQYLAHECDPVRLSLIAAHIMRLLQALERSGELRRGLANCSTLGIQLTDAARMPSGEWESLVLAASHSAIEHAQHNKKSTGPDCGLESTTNHAAPGLHPAVMQRDGVHAGCTQAPREHTSTIGRLNLPILIGAICKAHRLLQNASAVLFALPGGPRRRYLLELCDAVESSLQRLEALVLQLPFKDEAVSCARALAEIDVDATPHGQSGGGPIGGILGAVKWCIKAWHRVPDAPLHEGGFPGLSIEVLQAQAHFVVAVVQVWDESYASELERLLRSIHALKHAGLNGVFNNWLCVVRGLLMMSFPAKSDPLSFSLFHGMINNEPLMYGYVYTFLLSLIYLLSCLFRISRARAHHIVMYCDHSVVDAFFRPQIRTFQMAARLSGSVWTRSREKEEALGQYTSQLDAAWQKCFDLWFWFQLVNYYPCQHFPQGQLM